MNPLRDHHSVKWFKRLKNTTNINYTNTLTEKRKFNELQQLFQKFDEKGTGYLNMEDIHEMFKTVGVEVSIN